MKLLHIMRSVNPAEGGPIEALIQSDPVWRRLGHQREIVSLDTPGDPWVRACPIPTHAMGSPTLKQWQKQASWLRYGYTPRMVPWLRTHVGRYDTIVVNGLWNYASFAARRVLPFQPKPYFVFTHGMLDPWFRKAYRRKHCAKQMSWLVSEGPLLHAARAVLFTSEGECHAAQDAFWPYRFAHNVSGYGTADSPQASPGSDLAFRSHVPGLGDRPYLLFLGRLHRKKGCDLLLRAFAQVASSHPGIDLVLAGPDVSGTSAELMRLAEELSISRRVHWPGMLGGEAKWGALYGCTAFVLPSHGENFGIAVVEAMACGKPVLLSDRVNIAAEIAAAGAGLVRPDTVGGCSELLAGFFSLSDEERHALGSRARHHFLQCFDIEKVAQGALRILACEGPRESSATFGESLGSHGHEISTVQA